MESDPTGDGGDMSPTGTGPASNSKMRKRTKTGCLTCRKRRIKCGEERPTCANCIKSKRQCEGYNQRVIFKPPLGNFPDHSGVVSTLQYHNSSLPGSKLPNQHQDDNVPSIQPRRLTQFEYAADNGHSASHLNTQQVYVGASPPYSATTGYQQPLASPHHQLPTPTSATSRFPHPSPVHATFPGHYDANVGYQEQPQYPPAQYPQTPQQQSYYQQGRAYVPQSSISPRDEDFSAQFHERRPSQYRYSSHGQLSDQQGQVSPMEYSGAYTMPSAVSHADASHSSYQSAHMSQHVTSDVNHMPAHAVYEPHVPAPPGTKNEPSIPLSGFGGDDHLSPTQVLDEAAVEEVDDDYYDVNSDEEMLGGTDGADEDATLLNRDFSLIRRIHYENTSELTVRRYDAFIYDGILSQYKTEQVANPLKNPKTARVFAHFIHVTGPSLSIYERNPRNPTSIFEGPTPSSQQSLWTYVLPLKALGHQGLLHAMLAMASLHIAKLQRASITPSYKHYAYALKRLGRSLGNPKRRLSIATLATSLLLAFYEVMTAEHVKWSTHLVGCAHLISELDFSRLTQEARRLKAAKTEQESKLPYENPGMLIDQKQLDQRLNQSALMPDESMVSTIVGKKVSYDDHGRILEDAEGRKNRNGGLPGRLDLRTFETLQDLYWFYARQDTFQCMISGNPLITDFRKWSDCPPRAPLGRFDALYGTHDHIILLLARISDFTVRDRTRKLKQVDADGGQWRPRPGVPGMPMGPPPSKGGPSGPSSTPTGPPPHMKGMGGSGFGPPPGQVQAQGQGPPRGPPPPNAVPAFYGMAPSRPPISLPNSYVNPNYVPEDSPKATNAPDPKFSELPAAYEAAIAEWNSISHAHATVARFLANTETFAPLTPDLYPVAPGGNMTPFGPALVHRSYDISTLWNTLHLANILLLRSHPASPPAMHMAAGVCAQATQPYAMLIGRISAGMQMPATDDMPLSPFLGAALIETTMALFFAGVQYREPGQRAWLVKRLLDIDRRTGWASAAVIARSCETSWEKAAEMGKGPPYPQRMTRPIGEPGPIVIGADETGRAGGGWGGGAVRGGAGMHDRSEEMRFVVRRSGQKVRVPWAKNLLSTEEQLRADMEGMGLAEQ
ncbi:hypothetical protein CC80DRAFT_300256 [Byssothecium circinans]|uniref:Zn(2)-C6 fungal-type domain-containing protein n=1 Tax=Byssothecium circinans TaxID=147558 RepID=A0A6A5T7H6_9PLEO|nr:hypothetical protein CC80DRAFT_315021 [Byssothecium circinans]KAF1948603.1 hypothetical protein CC80DRAFT_300256 [Byssothecium circinans]